MLYIHVPFCKLRCIYCDFYSTTQGATIRRSYVEALCEELRTRADFLPTRLLHTLYFGGGTPSQLCPDELAHIMSTIRETFTLAPDAEVTLEANPDDITPAFTAMLRREGINRVSLGVQSFNDRMLQTLRRRHTAAQARKAVYTLVEGGITNVSIDLIYGLPDQNLKAFDSDLDEAFSLPVTHLSAYALSVEEGTPLHHKVNCGALTPAGEETCIAQYKRLLDRAAAAGFERYEISNFSLPGYRSIHNSSYWDDVPYLGAGPSAHSFDGRDRSFNLPDLTAYVTHPGHPPMETEHLTASERFDERVMKRLRTCEGLSLEALRRDFPERWTDEMLNAASHHLSEGRLGLANQQLYLTRKGLMLSDDIMSDLMRA